MKSWLFYIPTVVNIIGILVAAFFLIQDWIRRSSSNNKTLFLLTIAMIGWVALCCYLHFVQLSSLGTRLAWIPATPLLLYGIFLLLFIILKPDMK